eukprot:3424504-Alexandrium_andersonii.AAC.1
MSIGEWADAWHRARQMAIGRGDRALRPPPRPAQRLSHENVGTGEISRARAVAGDILDPAGVE